MKEKLDKYIKQHSLFKKEDKLLLAISGGADSVALAYLLEALKYNFCLGHCNFGLRGKESDNDEVFVKNLAKKLNVECVTKNFDTQNISTKNKVSIQMAARDLRYQWFEELRLKLDCNFIVTAHHRDDDIETFFINLLRGTGIKGMLGIHPKKGNVIRPLLFARKNEIYDFLKENKIEYREDSSNKEEKYIRNKIRLQLIPLLEDINPSIKETITKEMGYLNDVFRIYEDQIEGKRKLFMAGDNGDDLHTIRISSLRGLKDMNEVKIYLYEFLKPFGFSDVNAIIKGFSSQSGKKFFSKTHQLLIDRELVFITKINQEISLECEIEDTAEEMIYPVKMGFSKSDDKTIINDSDIAQFDFDKLKFPLILRKWKNGDKFMPLGMKQFKKLSDFFIDEKFTLIEKQQQWLLCSGGDIMWVIGSRIDERFKISENTKKVYIVQLLKESNV
ncbi:MAG: tRNA lysidine(34) synthetase TilS [Flavobacteriales bacterium]|nr:tRNA lysidine(34) synthetase TilS [Flavobacteriales bacterium]